MACNTCGERWQAVSRGRWEVGSGVEGLPVRGEENAHRPTALPGQCLGGLHVDGIDIGTFLAVHLDRHEMIVDHGRDLLIFEGLMRHHVAPMARRVPHGKETGT